MATRRTTVLKANVAAPTASTFTFSVGAPSWAERATLIVMGTTAAASTLDAKVQMGNPDGTSTAYTDSGVAIDQIAASSTAVGRYATWGSNTGAATAGTSVDQFAIPLSAWQRVSYTTVGTVTNVKIWIEFEGNKIA